MQLQLELLGLLFGIFVPISMDC